jgi:hypothetical protein
MRWEELGPGWKTEGDRVPGRVRAEIRLALDRAAVRFALGQDGLLPPCRKRRYITWLSYIAHPPFL